MHVTVANLLALQCTLCVAIRVPITWNDENSEVNQNNQFAYKINPSQNVASSNQRPIPTEYFQYFHQKPKFAVDIAKFHEVQSPEDHYRAYPIKPYTGLPKPELGKHQILNKEKNIFHSYQEPAKKKEAIRIVSPSKTSYEIFHPYKLEEPALKELYQDPVMEKIRSDIENNKIRLQKYENDAGQPDISKSEYLESPEETDRKKVPHKNVPAPYEIHRPQRRPVYYRPPAVHNQREHVLNQKLRHPWYQNHVKVKPEHYRPVKNHLQRLRQQHAMKYDDERNEYPQLPIPEKDSEAPEGYDIYEKGKTKFVQLQKNVDETLNEATQKNRPAEKHNLDLDDDDYDEDTNNQDYEDDFVPIKNYAQVRKTETTKHLPKEAAYRDADTLEEIQNAPRLREAVKSTKAQTVYSEEGYEDSAYDHAGEQKHASDHEEHKGKLKEKEHSNGKFKSPSISDKYEDDNGSEYHNQVLDGKKWKDTVKNTDKNTDIEKYSENEQEDSDTYSHKSANSEHNDDEAEYDTNDDSQEEEIKRIKREPKSADSINIQDSSDALKKIEVPETTLRSKLSNLKITKEVDNINKKYPYYYYKFKGISKDSPLRYAENLKFIPNKSEGGTEFYDSRAKYQCPEVNDGVDPIPEKLKKNGHPDDDEEDKHDDDDAKNSDENQEKSDPAISDQTPRLKGLGDKIDCFKAKYFGENPLDSPFFKEDIISNPEPEIIPSIDIYRLKQAKHQFTSKLNNKKYLYKDLKQKKKIDVIDRFNQKQIVKNLSPKEKEENDNPILPRIKPAKNQLNLLPSYDAPTQVDAKNVEKASIKKEDYQNRDTIKSTLRKRRATSFVYEPYKIIKDSQIQDSKKTTTSNNISPLIKQLQSSRVVDKVTVNPGKDQIVKRSTGTRYHKNIGKNEREKNSESKGSQPLSDASFVDVSVDQRRGEPRYELRSANYKSPHLPVDNKTPTTGEDKIEEQDNTKTIEQQNDNSRIKKKDTRRRRRPTTTTTTTTRPYFDVSKFLPQEETDKNDLVNHKTKTETNQSTLSQSDKPIEIDENDERNGEVEEEEEIHETALKKAKVTTKRSVIDTSTTTKPQTEDDLSITVLPKLRLVTRFQNSYQTEAPASLKRIDLISKNGEKNSVPKYREKKKKISKTTLVTDTNSYGEDNEDDLSKEEEVDALIGVNHDIKEYVPTYEIEEDNKKESSSDSHSESQEDDDGYEEDDHNFDDEDDEDDEDDDDDNEEDIKDDETETELKSEITTPAPVKRTLIKTTEIPFVTTEARSAKLQLEPVIVKKKLDIHKELPVNRSSPHVTEYKQDIKEIEVIKELPSRKKKIPSKNLEALELYKDDNLAKDINKLGGVEVFKEELDLINGPKHGGNYRSAEIPNTNDSPSPSSLQKKNENSSKGDVEAAPSKTTKTIELKDEPYSRRRSDIQRARNNRNRNAKLIELNDSTEKPTSVSPHSSNYKSTQDMRRRGGNRSAKLIELVDHHGRDDHSTNKHDSNSRSYGSRGGDRHQMHGGNYRSAKLVKTDDKARTRTENLPKKDSSSDERHNSALLLNSFARAVSVLTTPTPYILDPSKRMYYYVEA